MIDSERGSEIKELLNGEGLCARCCEGPSDRVVRDISGIHLGFCSKECYNLFCAGMEGSKDLRAL